MSRILRRPMFRGGSSNDEGIMSVPRRGYGDSNLYGVGNENSTELDINTGYENLMGNSNLMGLYPNKSDSAESESDGIISRGAINKKLQEGILAEELGLSPQGKRLADYYLSQRADPLGKFLINFGLNYMSARPKGGRFGAITTAAEAAKKPTEQLYADQDTQAALELKLLSAFGKEKDTDLTRLAKAWAARPENKGKTEQDFLGELAKRRLENQDLRDYSDRALIRKFGEDYGKEYKGSSDLEKQNAGIFKLRLEQNKIDKTIVGNLAPGRYYIESDNVEPRKDNPNILDITTRPGDYRTAYTYIYPYNMGIYKVQEQGGKKFLYKIGQYE